MTRTRKQGAEETRRRIYETALALFRDRGFDATTMRHIAKEAGVSLGATYHYFASKQAIALAYYEERQREHARMAREGFERASSLPERLEAAFAGALVLLERDRPFLPALARSAVDPDDSLSAFSPETRSIRQQAFTIYRDAVEHPSVPEDLRDALGTTLWAVHMGLLLYGLHDRSEGLTRTHRLKDSVIELVPALVQLLKLPGMGAARERLDRALGDSGLKLSRDDESTR
jgi:AcrR family transcriptional regulator